MKKKILLVLLLVSFAGFGTSLSSTCHFSYSFDAASNPLTDDCNSYSGSAGGAVTFQSNGIYQSTGDWGNNYSLEYAGDSTNSNYVDITNNPSIDWSSNWTISSWIKSDNDHNGIILSTDTSSTPGDRIFQFKKKDGGQIRIYYSSDGDVTNGLEEIVESGSIGNNEWVHAAVTHSPSTGLELYVNGTLRGSSSKVMDTGTDQNWRIGDNAHTDLSSTSFPSNPFDGNIDEVRVYEEYSNSSEIDNLYSSNSLSSASNSAPSASFTTSTTDLKLDVDASGSSDSDGSISSYEWDWTNDGAYEGSGETASHNYSSQGTYTVKLRVTDNDGATDTTTKEITVTTEGDYALDCEEKIFHYRLNDTTSTIKDYCGDLDGTANGNYTLDKPGFFSEIGAWGDGRSIEFAGDSTNSNYIDIPSSASVNWSSNWTISSYINSDNDHNGIILSTDESDYGGSNGVQRLFQFKKKDTGQIRFTYSDNGNVTDGVNVVIDSTSQPNNEWVHAAVTHSPSTGVELYVNGTLAGSNSSAVDNADPSWRIGDNAHQDTTANNFPSNPFDGNIDEISVYNVYSNQTEINNLRDLNRRTDEKLPGVSFSNPDPQDGKTGVNDTLDSSPIDVNVSLDITSDDNSSFTVYSLLNGTVKGQKTGQNNTSTSFVFQNLSEETRYDWSYKVDIDGQNVTSSTYSFRTNYFVNSLSFYEDRWSNRVLSSTNVSFVNDSVKLDSSETSGLWQSETQRLKDKKTFSSIKYNSEGSWDNWENFTQTITDPNEVHNPVVLNNGSADNPDWWMVTIDPGNSPVTHDIYERVGEYNWNKVENDFFNEAEINDICKNENTGEWIAYAGQNGMSAFNSTNLRGPWTNVSLVNSTMGDPGCAWDSENNQMHIYAEKGEPSETSASGIYIGHIVSDNGKTNWTVKPDVIDSSDTDTDVGDPRVIKVGEQHHIFYDWNRNSNLDRCKHNWGRNYSSFTNEGAIVIDASTSSGYDELGDCMPRFINGTWKMFYEANDNGVGEIWSAESPGIFSDGVSVKTSYDTNDDGSLDSSTSSLDLNESYSIKDVGNEFIGPNASLSISGYDFRVNVSLSDNSGKQSSLSYLTYDSPDTTAPSINILSPQNQTYNSASLDLNVTSDETIDTWQYSLDGGANQTFTPNTTLTGLSDATYTLDVYGNDSSGNTGSDSVTFTVDSPSGYIEIGSDVEIEQPGNNAIINVTDAFNISSLSTYNNTTEFGSVNWSISGSSGDSIDVKLSFFNDSVSVDEYLANYSVSSTSGNTITSSFTSLTNGNIYQVMKGGSFFDQFQIANNLLEYSFDAAGSVYESFSVWRSGEYRPEITGVEYVLDQQSSVEQFKFTLDDFGETDISSGDGLGIQNSLNNTAMVYNVSLPINGNYNVTDTSGLTSGQNVYMDKNDTGVGEDTNFSHNLDTQGRDQELNLTNNEALRVDYKWTSEIGNTFTGTVTGNSVSELSDSTTGDFINNDTRAFEVGTSEVVLGFNYTGVQDLEANNTVSHGFTGVSTDGAFEQVNMCSQTNNTAVDVNGGTNYVFNTGFDCNPGNIGNPTQDVVNISSSEERVWYNSTDMSINSNKTSNTNIAIRADKSNLKNPDNRDGGSLRAIVEGVDSSNSDELNVSDTGSFFRITVGDIQNSTLYTDDSDWGVTYTLSDDATDPSGGGGGGGGTSEDQIIYWGNSETEEGIETFSVPFGTQVERSLTVTNERQAETIAQLSRGSGGVCQYITVQRGLDSSEFGTSGSYEMPAATQELGTVESTESFLVRFDLPEQSSLEEAGVDLSCEFSTSSSYGTAEPLVIELEEGFSLDWLINWLTYEFTFEISDPAFSALTELDGDTVEFGIAVWQIITLLTVIAGGLYLGRGEF